MEKINYMKKIVSLKSNEKAELAKKISNINKNFNLNQDCYSLLKLIAEKGYCQKNNKEIDDFFQIFNNKININDNKKTNSKNKTKDNITKLIESGMVEKITTENGIMYILSETGNIAYCLNFKKNPVNPFSELNMIDINIDINSLLEEIIEKNTTADIRIMLEKDKSKETYFILKKATKIALMLEGIIVFDVNKNPIILLPSSLEEYQKFVKKISKITTRKILLIIQAMKNADGKSPLSNTCPTEIYEQLEEGYLKVKKGCLLKRLLQDNMHRYIEDQLSTKAKGTKLIDSLEYITLLL